MSRPTSHQTVTFFRQRLLALPLVLVCVLAYLGSAAHFVLVQHRTCLEHGELVHGDEAAAEGSLARAHDSFTDERITGSDAPESMHLGDVHCAQVFLRRVLPPPPAPLTLPPPEAPCLQARGVERECVEPPVAWLHLAPKLSPPQA